MPLSHLNRPVILKVPLPVIVPDRNSIPSTVARPLDDDPVLMVPPSLTIAGVPAVAPDLNSKLPEIVVVEPDLIFSPISP